MKKIIIGLIFVFSLFSHIMLSASALDQVRTPNDPITWLNYARFMLEKNDSQSAWAGLSQARKLIHAITGPSDQLHRYEAEYYQIEGEWYFQKKSFDRSINSFKQALKFMPGNLETQIALSCVWLADNKIQELTDFMAKIQVEHPNHEIVDFLYHITQASKDFSPKSEKTRQDLIKRQPALLAPKISLIHFYVQNGQFDLAKKILDQVPETEWTEIMQVPLALMSAQVSLMLNQPQEVVDKLKFRIQKHEDYRFLGLLSTAYVALGDFNRASTFFEKALKAKEKTMADFSVLTPANARQHNLGYIDSLLVNYYSQMQSNLTLMPLNLVKITYYLKHGQFIQAREEAGKFRHLYPNQAFSYDVLGIVDKTEGNYPKAEKSFKSAIKLNEIYLPARVHLVEILIKQRKYHEARLLLSDTSKKCKPDSKIFLLWSKLEEFEGNSDAAKQYLEKAVNLKQNLEPGLEFVSFYLRQDKPKLALLLAENLEKHHGNDLRLLNLLGGLYLENSQEYQKAVAVYQKLVQFLPESPSAIQNLAKAYCLSKQPKKSVAILEQYVSKYPDYIDVHKQLALQYLHDKNLEKAKLAFEKILKSHPEDYLSLHNLAMLYAEIDSRKSLALARQANEMLALNKTSSDAKFDWFQIK